MSETQTAIVDLEDARRVGQRMALVFGAGEFVAAPDRMNLRSVTHDLQAVRTVLADPEIGGFTVDLSENQPNHTVMQAVEQFFASRQREDLLLLYFVGHGAMDVDGELFFVSTDTVPELLRSTAIGASFISECMNRCRASRIIVVLDCSYGGSFVRGFDTKSVGLIEPAWEQLEGRGRVVLTSTSARENAFATLATSEQAPSMSVFTRGFVQGLATGDADIDGDGLITTDEIYRYVREYVLATLPRQTPTLHASTQGAIAIARSHRGRRSPPTEDGFSITRPDPPGAGTDPAQSALDSTDGNADEPDSPATEVPLREQVTWLSDETVGLEADSLHRAGVARVIEQKLSDLANDSNAESFLVHIDGAWGTGKSTLLGFLRESVSRRTEDPWLTISYDAWRQSKVGPPWLTLLQALRGGVRQTKNSRLGRATFGLLERLRLLEVWQILAVVFLALAAALALYLLLGTGDGFTLARSGDLFKALASIATVGAAVWLLARNTAQLLTLNSTKAAKTFLEGSSDPMEHLTRHFHWMRKQAGAPVLLLIDDLDRCPENCVVELLDTVQKLMRDKSPASRTTTRMEHPTLLVVVAADGRWIRHSYDATYSSFDGVVGRPGATVGTLFLEKIFQLSVPVPQLSESLQQAYLSRLLRSARATGPTPDGAAATEELVSRLRRAPRGDVLELLAEAAPVDRVLASDVVIDRLVMEEDAQRETRHALEAYAPLVSATPRAMKRFVMAYDVLRAVRSVEGSAIGRGPLALWTILRVRWPLLAEYLEGYPEDVRCFCTPLEDLPRRIPPALAPLFAAPGDDLRAVMNHADGPLTAEVIRKCVGRSVSSRDVKAPVGHRRGEPPTAEGRSPR